LIEDVKVEFRQNKNLTNENDLKRLMEEAQAGLESLKRFKSTTSTKGTHFHVDYGFEKGGKQK